LNQEFQFEGHTIRLTNISTNFVKPGYIFRFETTDPSVNSLSARIDGYPSVDHLIDPGGIGGWVFYEYYSELLPKGIKKAFVQLEFVIDKDGVPVNFKVIKGGVNEDFNDELITKLENTMATWQPAMLNDKPVPKKMVQTVTIEIPQPIEY
jgi:hypothetical protein